MKYIINNKSTFDRNVSVGENGRQDGKTTFETCDPGFYQKINRQGSGMRGSSRQSQEQAEDCGEGNSTSQDRNRSDRASKEDRRRDGL